MGEFMSALIPMEIIERRIYLIRGMKLILDKDLARWYGVSTARLKQQVRRNRDRFPDDFMIELTPEESERSRLQIATLKRGENIKYQPFAFSEQGVGMMSSVLRSGRAIAVNISIIRAFVRLREMLASHKELAGKLTELESHLKTHDKQILGIFDAIRQLMNPPAIPSENKRRIGYRPPS
jgi:hypothetical protein